MNFIQHTIEWYKGEVFEALLSFGFGIFIIILGIIFGRFGSTEGAQAMVIPLVVIGIIIGGSGAYNAYSNQKKIEELRNNSPSYTTEFIQSEKERVERFQYLYTFTKFLATGLFASALLIFFFVSNKNGLAIAITMIIMGLSGLVIDFFSKERADIYYEIILKQGS